MINRRKYSIANFKMNKSNLAVRKYLETLYELGNCSHPDEHRIVICPPFTSLTIPMPEAITITKNFFALGAQNISAYENGAYTGEISASIVRSTNLVKYVILGHSERREYFKETNQEINKKVAIALDHNLKPILCIGETLEQRKNNEVEKTLKNQLSKSLQNIRTEILGSHSNIIIAYEPVWAIGTGETATSKMITEAHQMIRNILNDIGFDGEKISILYGGSVNRNNAKELISIDDVDGFLIGGASLDVNHFYEIYKIIEESK